MFAIKCWVFISMGDDPWLLNTLGCSLNSCFSMSAWKFSALVELTPGKQLCCLSTRCGGGGIFLLVLI